MNDTSESGGPLREAIRHELQALGKHWWWFVVLGVALIVLGSVALGMSFVTSLVTVTLFGLLMLTAGIVQVIGSFWAGKWSGFLVSLLIGLLYTIAGAFVINHPGEAAIELTLLIAAMLIVSGIFRIVAALVLRFHDWGWPLLNGVITLILGIMIYRQWPASGTWVIGMFVGIDMIFTGWSWVMLGLGLRSVTRE